MPRRPLPVPDRGHRCEPVTQAERHHFVVPALASWRLSFERWHGRPGARDGRWVDHSGYATDERARAWCAFHRIAYPDPLAAPTARGGLVDPATPAPPLFDQLPPDHHDARALAAGEGTAP